MKNKINRTHKVWQEYLDKYLVKPPKLKVIPIYQTKDDKERAKLLSKIIEWQWPVIEGRIKDEIYNRMMQCFLYGRHNWKDLKGNRHKCKVCGYETIDAYDPVFTGAIEVFFEKDK